MGGWNTCALSRPRHVFCCMLSICHPYCICISLSSLEDGPSVHIHLCVTGLIVCISSHHEPTATMCCSHPHPPIVRPLLCCKDPTHWKGAWSHYEIVGVTKPSLYRFNSSINKNETGRGTLRNCQKSTRLIFNNPAPLQRPWESWTAQGRLIILHSVKVIGFMTKAKGILPMRSNNRAPNKGYWCDNDNLLLN